MIWGCFRNAVVPSCSKCLQSTPTAARPVSAPPARTHRKSLSRGQRTGPLLRRPALTRTTTTSALHPRRVLETDEFSHFTDHRVESKQIMWLRSLWWWFLVCVHLAFMSESGLQCSTKNLRFIDNCANQLQGIAEVDSLLLRIVGLLVQNRY